MRCDGLNLELGGSHDSGPCECCGNRSRTVWGELVRTGDTVAVYYVHWTLTRVRDHGANFDLVIGPWGDDTTPEQRRVVVVRYRLARAQPEFMVIDAADRPAAQGGELATTALRRDQVVGTPLASDVFAMLDAIWLGDERIRELTGDDT